MDISEGLVDYQSIVSARTSADLKDVINFLSDELPFVWSDSYKRLTPHQPSIDSIHIEGFEYLFDHSSELVAKGIIKKQEAVENRLVAVHGRSRPTRRKRHDSILRRQPLGPVEVVEPNHRSRYDRGHFIAHSLGGDLHINVFPQSAEINRGWSGRGKVFRSMERYCSERPGTYFFSRPFYVGLSAHPYMIEYGVLRDDGKLWVNLFPNCRDEEEMAEFERLYREKIAFL